MKRAVFMLIFICVYAASAQTLSLNGRQYRMTDGQWYQVEDGRQYPVNNSVITVKLREDVSPQRIMAFNASKGVQVLRTNLLGFVDLQIPANADPLAIVRTYLNSAWVEVAEPNTFGEYLGDPNDEKFPDQWFHKQTQDHDIDSPEAWDIETGSPSVIIGAAVQRHRCSS